MRVIRTVNYVIVFLFFSLIAVQGFNQESRNYMELFDTIPKGGKQIVFEDMISTLNKDSVIILSKNNFNYYGELDTATSPIYESNNGVLTLVGWDTFFFHPVDSTKYGILIGKCDTATLNCDTVQHFSNWPKESGKKPLKILRKRNNQLIAVVLNFDSTLGVEQQINTLFYHINKNDLRVDSISVLSYTGLSPINSFAPFNAIINPENDHVFISGWVQFRDEPGGGRGIIMELDTLFQIINHHTFYSYDDLCNIHELKLINNKLYFYGEKLTVYPEAEAYAPLSGFLGVLNINSNQLTQLSSSNKQWTVNRYHHIFSTESLLPSPNSETIFSLSRSISPRDIDSPKKGVIGKTLLTAYDLTGNEIWDMKYDLDEPGHDSVYDYFPTVFNFTADSNIFILGLRLTLPRDNRFNFFTIIADRSDGTLLHSHIYKDPPKLFDKQYSAGSLLLSNGNIIAGGGLTYSSPKGFLQKYNSKGCRGYCIEQDTTGIRQFSPPEVNTFHYPNPAHQNINFSGITDCGKCKIQFFDISGKLTMEIPYQKTVGVSSLSKGLHLLRVVNQKGETVYTGKSIVQ